MSAILPPRWVDCDRCPRLGDSPVYESKAYEQKSRGMAESLYYQLFDGKSLPTVEEFVSKISGFLCWEGMPGVQIIYWPPENAAMRAEDV